MKLGGRAILNILVFTILITRARQLKYPLHGCFAFKNIDHVYRSDA